MTEGPTSSELDRIFELQKERKFDEALQLAADLQARYPEDDHVRKRTAHVYEAMKQLDRAIREISEAIARAPSEPDYYMNRARWHLDTGCYDEAVADCSTAIDIEASTDSSYYSSTLYFFRALAKFQLADYQGCLKDCQNLDDDFAFWALGSLQTKKVLVQESKQRLGGKG